MNYFENLLTAIDQLGNAIAGGNPDVTVSGRVGYHSVKTNNNFWKSLEKIIDFTFEPIDGRHHCLKTALNDDDIDSGEKRIITLVVLAIIAAATCLALAPLIRVFSYSKKLLFSCRTK